MPMRVYNTVTIFASYALKSEKADNEVGGVVRM